MSLSEIGHRLKHPKKAAMLAALAKTGNVSASARAADSERCTHYRWLHSEVEAGYIDIGGLPWTEIDFPEDLEKAERILEALRAEGLD